MNKKLILLAALVATAVPGAASAQTLVPLAGSYTKGRIPDRYICVFRAQRMLPAERLSAETIALKGTAQALVSRMNGQVDRVFAGAIQGFTARMSATAAARMQLNSSIAFCEQDQVVKVLAEVESVTPAAVAAPQAQQVPWGVTRVGGGTPYTGGRRAWVIDTGIDLDHPDLRVDTTNSRSFVAGETTADDGNGHGTHVAGIIGARANSIGVAGVAANARVVAVKVLGANGSGTISGVIAGIDYVASRAAALDVANLSLGGGASTALDTAVQRLAARGVRVVLAAGNENQNANNVSPARVNGTNIYTVSAFAQGDRRSSFSNFGNPPIDFGQPGSSIYSTYKNGGYATLSGTSMAAPHLAGLLLRGTPRVDGTVVGDNDGTRDPIAVR